MRSRPPVLLSQGRLMTCILINQLATPGLGTLLARRIIPGTGQLILSISGISLIVVWMFYFFHGMVLRQLDPGIQPHTAPWLLSWGSILFGASWLWALVSSAGLWRQAIQQQKGNPCTKSSE